MEFVSQDSSFLLAVINEAPYGIVVFNEEGLIVFENQLARNFVSSNAQSLINTQIKDHFDVFEMGELLTQVIEGRRERFDIMELFLDDKVLTVRCRKSNDWSILTVQDITKWKHIEMNAVQSVIGTQEKERQRIALEIHDGIGPQLSTSIHQLETIAQRIKVDSPDVAEELESLADLSNEISTELRSLSHALMPRVLLDFGITAALQNLVNKVNSASDCNIEFIHSFSGDSLNQDIELNLYRICQELLNNAVKHADAKSIFVQLVKNNQYLTLTLEDDGKGFDLENLKNAEGIGISNIEMRSKVLGGEFNIDSSPGRGSIITVEVPIHEH